MDWNRTKNDRYWNRNFKRIWNRQALIPEFLIKTIKRPVSDVRTRKASDENRYEKSVIIIVILKLKWNSFMTCDSLKITVVISTTQTSYLYIFQIKSWNL